MIIWNDYSKYNVDLGIDERTFGEMVRSGYKLPKDYPFYNEVNRAEFEKKFYKHFKYNQIAFTKTTIFSDMFQDVMYLNYPKYKHYYDVLEKTKSLKWWNNKDFIVKLQRELDRSNVTNFETTMKRIDNFTSNMIRTGELTNDFERKLASQNNEQNGGTNTSTTKKTGTNTNELRKTGDITNDFTRSLTSSETQDNSDTKKNNTVRTSLNQNNSTTNSTDEKTSNSTTKNLDTPQGTLDNLMSNVNAYMTTGTVESNRDTDINNTTVHASNEDKSEDITLASGTDKKNINGTEGGTTKNTETFKTIDINSDRLDTTDTTTEILGHTKNNNMTETGTTKNTETRNTKDALSGNKTGNDTGTNKGTETGKDIETFTRTEEGNIGVTSAGQLVEDWLKKGYINLDKMIIRDCEELFLQVY